MNYLGSRRTQYVRAVGIGGGYFVVSTLLYQLSVTSLYIFAYSMLFSVGVVVFAFALDEFMTLTLEAPHSAHLTSRQLLAISEFEVVAYGEVLIHNPTNPQGTRSNYVIGELWVPAKASTLRFIMHFEEWEDFYRKVLAWNIPTWARRDKDHVKYRGMYGPYARRTRLIKRRQGVSVWVTPHKPRSTS